ncbi:uncharacterized protein [Porites lutea]|uniref:uncharacterized protein n=1 Tax=Porites lutea TaxID=51062 RepID=UPI003CC54985
MKGEMECIIFVLLGVVDVCITFMSIFSPRLEIQYKHLLTLWRTRHWNLKQALSKEQVFTQVKVIKSTSPDKGKLPLLAGSKDAEQILRDIQMPDDQEIVGITERLVEQEPVTSAATGSLNENPPETLMDEAQTLDKQSSQSTLNDLLAWLKKAEGILSTMSEGTLNQGSLYSSLEEVKVKTHLL